MRRRVVFLLALLAAVAAGVASASAITAQLAPDTAASPPSLRPDGGGARMPVTVADPDGGGRPAFALRVYRSEGGLTCPEVGRTENGSYGLLDAGGDFAAQPADAAGSCVDLGDQPIGFAVNHYTPRSAKAPARAAIFGVATGAVTSVALATADGASRPVRIAGGAFLTVVRDDALAGATLDVTLGDGTTTSYPLSPQELPQTVPDGAPAP